MWFVLFMNGVFVRDTQLIVKIWQLRDDRQSRFIQNLSSRYLGLKLNL